MPVDSGSTGAPGTGDFVARESRDEQRELEGVGGGWHFCLATKTFPATPRLALLLLG